MVTKESLQFLKDLKKNNNRDWFQEQKKRYEAYKENYLEVTTGILDALAENDPELRHLEPKKCQFRINRDIRFSKDKSPYKTHMGIFMSESTKENWGAGYYVHIEPGASFIAGGVWQPYPETTRKIRKEIEFFHDELEAILNEPEFKKQYGALDTADTLKTIPKGFEKDHPAAGLLKLKSWIAQQPISDAVLTGKNFEKEVAAKLSVLLPLNNFIRRSISNPDS